MIFFAACEINGETPKSEISRENTLKSEKIIISTNHHISLILNTLKNTL